MNIKDIKNNNPFQSDFKVEQYYQNVVSELSKQEIYLYHQLTRRSIQDVNLGELQHEFEGLEYRRFMKRHYCIASCDEILLVIASKFAAFNTTERKAAKIVLKSYDQKVLNRDFWLTDTHTVLCEIGMYFEELLKAKDCQSEDKMKFNLFQLISSNLAFVLLHDKRLRKIANIRKSWITSSWLVGLLKS